MTEPMHTEGPWRLGSPLICCSKPGPHNEHDCEYTFQHWLEGDGWSDRCVSSAPARKEIVGFNHQDMPTLSPADARLIAAAPEMLEALESAVFIEWDGRATVGDPPAHITEAHDAIRKAKGEQ